MFLLKDELLFMENPENQKSERTLREEAVLKFWQENRIFEKTLEKEAPKGEFVFYEGPPTANAKPALHHLEARVFKDALPRYKTMRGYRVPRKAGWDTHGLPVELQIEKKLGLASKKDIEQYGVEKFNRECKQSVFEYIGDWEKFTERIGYWVNFEDAYYTFDNSYIETLWGILKRVEDSGLLYKDYKVLPWCPRCGTALSSHELAQGYQDVKDISIYAKFPIKGFPKAYFLAWTTTPWTLPGNVALAVGPDIEYVEVKIGEEIYVLAKERLAVLTEPYEIVATHKGSEMVGMEYEPLYDFSPKNDKSHKVYAADFVTTTDGTGIVHTAVMYGQDDFELGSKIGLPKQHLVDDTGHYKPEAGFLAGKSVVEESTAVEVLKDLQARNLLFKKESYTHSYPFCWRCKTRLIYYARDSWYISMSKLRNELVKENESINWEPEYIKEGRFGEWLREIKDWAISRERYWGTPLPVWENKDKSKRLVADSLETLKKYSKKSKNRYFVMRHGESQGNAKQIVANNPGNELDHLSENGREETKKAAELLKGTGIDLIISSDFERTKETSAIAAETLGLSPASIVYDPRIREINAGVYNGKPYKDYHEALARSTASHWMERTVPEGESLAELRQRIGEFLYDTDKKYSGKNILLSTHSTPAWMMFVVEKGEILTSQYSDWYLTEKEQPKIEGFKKFVNAEVRELDFAPLPHNDNFELDLHRPYIDEVVLEKDAEEYHRVKEVMDVWFDSGSMPFAQDPQHVRYPADFISEAIDQTRGWFYTLHAVGVLMGKGKAFKNVICLGHILDKDGKKMSKSVGNIVDPWMMMDKYGVDALRLWMYSVNQPGESKNFDENTVNLLQQQFFGTFSNVLAFYELYRDKSLENNAWPRSYPRSANILDRWILDRLYALIARNSESLDNYKLLEPVRNMRAFIEDLSVWYLRRSRERIKEGDTDAKATLYFVLKTFAKLLAPFAPFAAEDVWQRLKKEGDEESVHLSAWPETPRSFSGFWNVEANMEETRKLVTLGLEARQRSGIKVRQPLSKLEVRELKVKNSGGFLFWKDPVKADEYLSLVKEELNVKDIVVNPNLDTEVRLDTNLTPELLEEGKVRDAIRAVQEWRKEKNLKPGEKAQYETADEFYFAHQEEIEKATNVELSHLHN